MIRRTLAWMPAAFTVAAMGAYVAFACIPHYFGRRVGAGFSGVESGLCVLDRGDSARLIIAGDSRAGVQVDPRMIERATGLRSINIVEALHSGGDLTTLVNVLRKHPAALASRPILLISVSLDGINDLGYDQAGMAQMLNFTPLDHLRLVSRDPAGYLPYLCRTFLPFLAREARHMRRREGFSCTDEMRLASGADSTRGGPAYPRQDKPGGGKSGAGFLLDGGRWKSFLASLDWLAKSPARVILFNGPVDEAWLRGLGGANTLEAKAEFSRMAARETARRGFTWWDFEIEPPRGLSHEHFRDPDHLNALGTPIFTQVLANRLSAELRKNPAGVATPRAP